MTYSDTSLYDARTGLRLKILQSADSTSSGNALVPTAFSPDSRRLLARSSDSGRLEIWDARAARRLRVLPQLEGAAFWAEPRSILLCTRDSVRLVPAPKS